MVPVQLTGMGRSPFPASRSRLGTELSSSGSDTPSPAADTLTGSQREPRAVSDQAAHAAAAGGLLLTLEYQKQVQVAEKREEELQKNLEQAD